MKSIAFFNNKGGVGKTTLLCNIASYISIKDRKKVIIIDADPQSNATIYLLDFDKIIELYKKPNSNGTINELFKDLRKTSNYYNKDLPITTSDRFSVDLIPGDPNISLFEDFLSKDWFDGINGEPRGLRTTLVFLDLINKLKFLDYDYAFFDVGPSLGAINRSVLLACDYFLLPMSSDIFSLKALENIDVTLNNWKKSFSAGIVKYRSTEKETFQIKQGEAVDFKLKFIGYITQQYTAKKKEGVRQAVRAYDKIIKEIPAKITEHLVPFNSTQKKTINYSLGEIPTLHSLIPLSQKANAPIFDLKADDGIVGAHFAKVKDFEEILKKITVQLKKNLSTLS
jgi:cellulose biosynthesis protein BcsQ